MSIARFRIPTSQNIRYEAQHANLAPSALVLTQNKETYLTNDTNGNLLWESPNQANSLLKLNGSARIDSQFLPSYVDDIISVANLAELNALIGETGKIYITLDTNKIYRKSVDYSYIEIMGFNHYTKAETDTLLGAKLNVSNPVVTGTLTANTISSTGLTSSLALKADTTAMNSALALKADLAGPTLTGTTTANHMTVNGTLTANTISSTGLASSLALKADTTAMNSALALKADTTAMNSALALKADLAGPTLTGTTTANNMTVNGTLTANTISSTGLTSSLALKADTTAMNSALALKADTTAMNSALALKADLAGPTFTGTTTANNMTVNGTLTANNMTVNGTLTANTISSTGLTSSLALKSNLASPTFTGTVTIPTLTCGVIAPPALGTLALSSGANNMYLSTSEGGTISLASGTHTMNLYSTGGFYSNTWLDVGNNSVYSTSTITHYLYKKKDTSLWVDLNTYTNARILQNTDFSGNLIGTGATSDVTTKTLNGLPCMSCATYNITLDANGNLSGLTYNLPARCTEFLYASLEVGNLAGSGFQLFNESTKFSCSYNISTFSVSASVTMGASYAYKSGRIVIFYKTL